MKKNKFNAFTIAEALISFMLIGMIFILTLSGLNRKIEYNQLYLQAFNTLYQASKSAYASWINTNANCSTCETDANKWEACSKSECWRNSKFSKKNSDIPCDKSKDARACQERTYAGGTANIDRDWPGFLYGSNARGGFVSGADNTSFCELLTENINTYPKNKCLNFIYKIDNEKSEPDKNAVNFYKLFSNDDKNGIAPSFISSNGQQFYISDIVTARYINTLNADKSEFNHSGRESYRLVVVDLNGKSAPNTQFQTKNKNPDLVLFAINSTGDVIPLGLPEISKEYIKAVVYYPPYTKEDGTLKFPEIKSKQMTLWDAKKIAWGITDEYINQTVENVPAPLYSPVSKYEPLSQSSKLYKIAQLCRNKKCNHQVCTTAQNKETAVCHDATTTDKEIYADDLLVQLLLQFIYKEEGKLKQTIIQDFYDDLITYDFNILVDKKHDCISVKKESDNPTCSIDFEN